MPPSPRRRRADLLFFTALALFALLFLAGTAVRSVEPLGIDQGLFACFTRFVPRGLLPYRDLFDSKPPLFLYSYSLAALFPTDLVHAIWLLDAVWLAAILALAFALGARAWNRWVGLAAAGLLLLGMWAPGFGGYWARAQADEFVALPLLGAAWLALAALDRPRLALCAGVLTGVAGLFKIPSMAVAAAWPLAWLLDDTQPNRLRGALGRTLQMALGIALPWALAVGWFAAHHALGDFTEGVFVYARHNAEFIAPPLGEVLTRFPLTLAHAAPLLLFAGAIGAALLFRRRARERVWLTGWVLSTMASVMLERQLAGYQFLLVLPGLALAGGVGLVELARGAFSKTRLRPFAALGLAGALALCCVTIAGLVRGYRLDALAFTSRISRAEYLAALQPGGFSSATEEQAARYLDTHSAPDDQILVWGLSPGIYALADRRPATRFPFHKILLTEAPLSLLIPGLPERRAAFARRLAVAPPLYILVGRHDQNGFEPESSFASMMRFVPLRERLERDYREETTIGQFVLFRRAAAPPAQD